MFEKNLKTKTNLGLVVTFAVLMGACTSKQIKMESSELALDVPEKEQVLVGDATSAPLDDGTMLVNEDTYKAPIAKKAKRKGMKSMAKKSKKSRQALASNRKQHSQVSAAGTVAKEIEAPKMEAPQTFEQELSQYPSNDSLNNIVVPAPMEEAAMVEDNSSTGFWMYVLAGFLVTLGAAGYVYKTRFAKAISKGRKLVYRG